MQKAPEILNELIRHLKITLAELSLKAGYERPQAFYDVANGKTKNISPTMVDRIVLAYPDVSRTWLLTGEGDMLKHSTLPVSQEARYETFLLPISAQGGSLSNFADSVTYDQCERITSPIKDVSFAMSVTGDSMEPEYPSGSKILIKKINERAFIEWGRCYVLDTCNGAVIKKLMPADDDLMFRCVSTNPTYPSFDVCLSDIYGVYRVLMVLAEK